MQSTHWFMIWFNVKIINISKDRSLGSSRQHSYPDGFTKVNEHVVVACFTGLRGDAIITTLVVRASFSGPHLGHT